jgi:NAD(P)H-nitrite reductase large subunit
VDDPDVYVVGECAQHRGRVYGLVAPLWEQAKVFAEHVTGRNPAAAYHGSKRATKLKVMGVELASMGITEPAEERDEIIQFTEPKKGTYKKLIVRDGRLVGGILLGDISKAAYLMQCFDRDAPLPDERLSLLFDLGTPSQKITIDEMPAEMQVCNCNGVTKAAIATCVASGKRSTKAVMDSTRAGKGCGSCKGLVGELVARLCGGEIEEDPSIHYYVPSIPLRKSDLVKAIREQNLKSVSAVFKALAGGVEDASSKPALCRFSLRCGTRSMRTNATRASSTTACTPIPRRTAPFRLFPRSLAACARRRNFNVLLRWPSNTTCRSSSSRAASASTWSAFPNINCRISGAISTWWQDMPGARAIAPARAALGRTSAASGAWGLR